jgi:hypothetical protein
VPVIVMAMNAVILKIERNADGAYVPSFEAQGVSLGEVAVAIKLMRECLAQTEKQIIDSVPAEQAAQFSAVCNSALTSVLEVDRGVVATWKQRD